MTEEDPPIVQEPPPRVTPLTGDEAAPDPTALAAMFWLVRRYSSYAYIDRAYTLLRLVNAAFSGWARRTSSAPAPSLRATTRVLDGAVADFQRGLGLLEAGQKTPAYHAVAEALGFREALLDARGDRGLSLEEIHEHLGPAVGLAAERACAMALRIRHTLAATWTCETILADRPSLRTRPLRLPNPLPPAPSFPAAAPEVETDDEVEQAGIYLPTTIRDACPNLLLAGADAPRLTRACERIDYAGLPAVDDEPADPPWTDYEYSDDEPTTWRLAWADERYRDGLVVPEPEHLDEETAIPEGLA